MNDIKETIFTCPLDKAGILWKGDGMKIVAYTDGACTSKTNAGAWASVLVSSNGEYKELSGGYYPDTTNNQMELFAVLETLNYLRAIFGDKLKDMDIKIVSDSKYVVEGATSWLPNWKKNGWKTASKSKVKNRNLWEILDTNLAGTKITFEWVEGHADNEYNERADVLSNTLSQKSIK